MKGNKAVVESLGGSDCRKSEKSSLKVISCVPICDKLVIVDVSVEMSAS